MVEGGCLVSSLSASSEANQKDFKHVAVVHGIPPNTSVDALLKAFGECGKIVRSEVGSVREGKRQYAVLEFEDEDSLMVKSLPCTEGNALSSYHVSISYFHSRLTLLCAEVSGQR